MLIRTGKKGRENDPISFHLLEIKTSAFSHCTSLFSFREGTKKMYAGMGMDRGEVHVAAFPFKRATFLFLCFVAACK